MSVPGIGGRRPRKLLKRLLGWTGELTGSGGLVDAIFPAPRQIAVTGAEARIAGLPAAWAGARIALLTDLHAGPLCGLDYLRRVVELTNAQSPDVSVLAGDLVSTPGAIRPALARILGELRAPAGRFAVLGNHDWYCGAEAVRDLLADAGIELLLNAHRILWRNGAGLCIAGVDDWFAGWADAAAALAGADSAAPRILISHNPDILEELPEGIRVDFALCGHTHGGQIRLPLGWIPYLPIRHRKYLAGLVAGPCCPAYISRGIGMVCLPIRLGCRPELPILTLRPA